MGIPKLNFTAIPNVFIEEVMRGLGGSAVKLFLVICRKTIGWHKDSDALSYSQLQEFSGIKSQACAEGLKDLVDAGLVTIHREQGKTSRIDLAFETSLKIKEVGDLNLFENQSGTSLKIKETKEREIKKEKGSTLSSDRTSPKPKPDLMYFSFTDSLWYGITDEQVALWAEAYPACDIEMELRQMGEWCKANGSKGKKVNWRRFVVNWLKRAQDRGGSEPKGGNREWNKQRYSR